MRRTKEEAAQTRIALLEEALAVFSEKGYPAATLAEIAAGADVTRGAVYWHFGSKAELYSALIEEFASRRGAVLQRAVSGGGSLINILRRAFISQLEAVEQDPMLQAVSRLQLLPSGTAPELEAAHQKQMEAHLAQIEVLTGLMDQGKYMGLLRQDMEAIALAHAYLAFQDGLIREWLTMPHPFSMADLAGQFADVLIAGLQAGRSNTPAG